jgi:hypothetical protein
MDRRGTPVISGEDAIKPNLLSQLPFVDVISCITPYFFWLILASSEAVPRRRKRL